MILVDFDMLCHRCYRAMDHLQTKGGRPTGMEYGVMRLLKGLGPRITKYPQHIVLCLESHSKIKRPSFYKANREKPPASFYKRKNELLNNLKQVYHWAMCNGHEADQVMHTLSRGNKVNFIYSNDSDMYQSITNTTVVVRSYEHQLFFWTEDSLWEKFLVHPFQYGVYKAIIGDKTDNIPGISRIQKKLAAEIARKTINIKEKCYIPLYTALVSVLEEYKHRVSSSMRQKFEDFMGMQLQQNIDLIIFKEDIQVGFSEPLGGSIQKYLDTLEIKSIAFEEETEF